MTNRCGNPDCNRPFGLIRFSWRFEQFCSNGCREIYKRRRERHKTYWKWLYKCPDRQGAIMTTAQAMLVGAALAWGPSLLVFAWIVQDLRNTRSK